jgi:hypothetical protein
MMQVSMDGRDVCVRLNDDVWQLSEPGTICLTPAQVQHLRFHLNQLVDAVELQEEHEDG